MLCWELTRKAIISFKEDLLSSYFMPGIELRTRDKNIKTHPLSSKNAKFGEMELVSKPISIQGHRC